MDILFRPVSFLAAELLEKEKKGFFSIFLTALPC